MLLIYDQSPAMPADQPTLAEVLFMAQKKSAVALHGWDGRMALGDVTVICLSTIPFNVLS